MAAPQAEARGGRAYPGCPESPDQARQAKDEHPEHEEHRPGDVEDEVDCDPYDDVHDVSVSVEYDGAQPIKKRLAPAHELGSLETIPAQEEAIQTE